jgi:hypothetical protein
VSPDPVGLTRAEEDREKPSAAKAPVTKVPDGYWPGSAYAELVSWRTRALAAEAELARLKNGADR